MKKYGVGIIGIAALAALFIGGYWYQGGSFESLVNEVTETDAPPLPITLTPKTITFSDGTDATFEIPEGFEIAVAAEGLGKVRFMAESPDGRIFVPDLIDYLLSPNGKVLILEDFNEETKQFETQHTYLSGLQGVNSVAFYRDDGGQDWLYVATVAALTRYPYQAGDVSPSGKGEVVATFPAQQAPGEVSVVWHITRSIEIHDDRFYISIGSGCNSCEDPLDLMRGMVVSMNPDGSDVRVYADGLRNAVGLEWANGALYATENGVDHLGIHAPDERLYVVEEGKHYAWPYCYQLDGEVLSDNSQTWNTPIDCRVVAPALTKFPPRSAPLGLTYFDGTVHSLLRNSFLVSLHGSFDVTVQSGYELVRVLPTGEQEIFMRGFLNEQGERIARPVHVLQKDRNSFFLTDDYGGRILYLYAK